jgi:nitrite reductase/ring-hydroxylating ferredoxin subunit/uncharacterized membrane protein
MASETIPKVIDQQKWLDPLGEAIQAAVHKWFEAGGDTGQLIKDLLHGTWLGHPLHPALTNIPIGAWTAALALDALEGISGRRELRAGADAAIGLGLLGAVGSAVTGLTDWSDTYGRGRKIGLVHGILNVAATGLYTGSWIMRKRRKSRAAGVSLSMLGYAVASAAAYLGGHLVFGEQVGIDHTATADRGKPEKFTAVMDDAALAEKKLTRVDANGVAVLLVRVKGKLHALAHTCTHLGGPLSEGKLVEGNTAVECPWHCSRFALEDGSVVNGPATFPEPRFEVRVRNGKIEVRATDD